MEKFKMICFITINDPLNYDPECFRLEIDEFNKSNSPGMSIEVGSVEKMGEGNLKCYRVWIDDTTAVLVDAWGEIQARFIVYAGMKEGKYQGEKITKVECLS